MAVRWRQGHQETPVVSGAQTLLSTDTKEESGSQTLGRAEEHDKDSGLGTRASTQDPNLSWSATLPGTEVFLGTLGFQCQRNRDDLVTLERQNQHHKENLPSKGLQLGIPWRSSG